MHNKINLLKSWLVRILSFMFILNSSTFATSSYLEQINIPAYNASDPTHVLITEANGKWTDAVLNNLSYKHFYIEPGDYTATVIALTSSGTDNDRRTLSLHNGNDTHPASLPDNEVANVTFHLNGASYWTFDRLSNVDKQINRTLVISDHSTHNILNRYHLRGFYDGIRINGQSHYNTIQNSYIHYAPDAARDNQRDAIGIVLHDCFDGQDIAGSTLEGTKIINNDISNATDEIQLYHLEIADGFPGTIIDSNRIWKDSEIACDEDGTPNPNGGYMITENNVDTKHGSPDSNRPVIFSNNILWGVRAPTRGNELYGKGITSHHHSQNIIYDSNIFFESQILLFLDFGHSGNEPIELRNNIFVDNNVYNPKNADYQMLYMAMAADKKLYNNTFLRNGQSRAIYIAPTATGNNVADNNVFIDTSTFWNNGGNIALDNTWYYNHAGIRPSGTNEQNYGSISNMADYTFEYKRFTANPETKILQGIISTEASPHYRKAGSSITMSEPILATEDRWNTRWIIVPSNNELLPQ